MTLESKREIAREPYFIEIPQIIEEIQLSKSSSLIAHG
jgi:hypothetical protein